MEKLPIIIITGPTAGGKTALSIAVAKKTNGEVISADSMQIYKYMDIGTAKITKEEAQGVKHYLIDELYPNEAYSVALFQEKAEAAIRAVMAKGKTPIVVGGTGFYINALLYGNQFTQTEQDEALRRVLYARAEERGCADLHKELSAVDPEAAMAIHPNNIKRVVRALEFFKQTNKKISDHNREEHQRLPKYEAEIVVLTTERAALYRRIDERVDQMIRLGLLDEVRRLLFMGYDKALPAMQGLGYKETVRYLENEWDWDKAVFELKKGTRHFAKRQLTWFRRQLCGDWYDVAAFGGTARLADEITRRFFKKSKNTTWL